jgi:hypothetical protein
VSFLPQAARLAVRARASRSRLVSERMGDVSS